MKKLVSLLIIFTFILGGCGSSDESEKTIVVGASASPHAEILKQINEALKEEGYTLEIKVFDDYIVPNTAVQDEELDANYFQHKPYLTQFNEDNDTRLVSVGAIHYEPLGLYSNDTTKTNQAFTVADVKEGSTFLVPDDGTNQARALYLLEAHGIIKLKEGIGLKATELDIVENPKNVKVLPMEAQAIAPALDSTDYAVINGNYALTNKVENKLICTEQAESSDGLKTYANVLVVKEGNEDSEKTKALLKALKSTTVKDYIQKTYGDLVAPAFD